MEKTAKRWRKNAPDTFEYTIKAWQLITHPSSSPTYRKLSKSLENKKKYGEFQPTEEIFDAFDTIKTIAHLLESKTIVFQTPASFILTEQHKKNIKVFFSSITNEFTYRWEARGEWNPDTIIKICEICDLIHVVDPFKESPQTDPLYFRLHGSPPGE